MDKLQLVVCMGMTLYFVISAVKLYKGKDAQISGYTSLPPEDQKCYDDRKIKKYASFMNAGCAVGTFVLGLTAIINSPVLIILSCVIFLLSLVWFRYLLMRTSFFIKKDE